MAAKTIMKRIAIAALSAVILQGVTPLDSLNVYASENTGASYTALDLYTYIQDQCSTEYTLTEKAETFLEEHDDFFPASPELVIPDEMIDAELDFRHINKNPSRYGDKLMRISDAYGSFSQYSSKNMRTVGDIRQFRHCMRLAREDFLAEPCDPSQGMDDE